MYLDNLSNSIRYKSVHVMLIFALTLFPILVSSGVTIDHNLINRVKLRMHATAKSTAYYVVKDFKNGSSDLIRKLDETIQEIFMMQILK